MTTLAVARTVDSADADQNRAPSGRNGEWLADPGFGVYVHIPFCLHRCHYCDFNTYEGQDDLYGAYVDALVREVERWRGEVRRATSVFFGGGTPTLLAAPDLGRILAAVRDRVGLAADAEITIEANPETVDEAKFEQLLNQGFNRVSIGVQSLVPRVLVGLGRTHSRQRALDAIAAARRAGAGDVNVDLIYGSPWERPADWRTSLQGVIEAEPDHVSAYALTVEDGTPLATMIRTGRLPDVDPDVQAERYAVAAEVLGQADYHRYEVSNWAKPGRSSRHNVLYWSAGDYFGFGAGAHAHVSGRRWWSTRLPRDFIAAVDQGRSTEAGAEVLDEHGRAREAVMLGLRLTGGIDIDQFRARFGALPVDPDAVARLKSDGLLDPSRTKLRAGEASMFLLNEIICQIL